MPTFASRRSVSPRCMPACCMKAFRGHSISCCPITSKRKRSLDHPPRFDAAAGLRGPGSRGATAGRNAEAGGEAQVGQTKRSRPVVPRPARRQGATVLVAWADRGKPPLGCRETAGGFDYLGRARSAAAGTWELAEAPLFLLFSGDFAGEVRSGTAAPAGPATGRHALARRLAGRLAAAHAWLRTSRPTVLRRTSPSRFRSSSTTSARSRSKGDCPSFGPKGWKLSLPGQVTVRPGERVELALGVDLHEVALPVCQAVTLRGDFQTAGTPVLSLRLLPDDVDKPRPRRAIDVGRRKRSHLAGDWSIFRRADAFLRKNGRRKQEPVPFPRREGDSPLCVNGCRAAINVGWDPRGGVPRRIVAASP